MFGWFRWGTWALAMVVCTTIGLLMFAHYYLDVVAHSGSTPLLEPLIEELSSSFGVAFLVPWVIHFARRHPLDRAGWPRRVPAHLANLGMLSVLHTSWNWLARETLFPALGMGDYDYGHLPTRYAMELPNDVLWYAVVIGFVYLLDHYRAARERELRTAQLETRLTRAQLQNLQAQLNPHFLFNALNTVSSVMYEDVVRADRMLSGLSDLLRRALHASDRQEVTLEEELEVLELYAEIMRARFGDRLAIETAVEPGVRAAMVPTLVLQPLVENAIHHGAPPPPGPARVRVRAWREGDRLLLRVEDNGPGLAGEEPLLGRGVGLTNTADRLRGLYGARQALELCNAPGGGLRATIQLPYHTDPSQPATVEEPWTASAR